MPPPGLRVHGLQGNLVAWPIGQRATQFSGLTIRSSRDRFAVSRVSHSPAAVRLNSGVRPMSYILALLLAATQLLAFSATAGEQVQANPARDEAIRQILA